MYFKHLKIMTKSFVTIFCKMTCCSFDGMFYPIIFALIYGLSTTTLDVNPWINLLEHDIYVLPKTKP
jgi:hypothetical protein